MLASKQPLSKGSPSPAPSPGGAGAVTCLVSSVDQGRLKRARAVELPVEVVRDVADIFSVLADPTRVAILRALGEGELCVCELVELLGLSVSAISHQLRKLRDRRVVDCRMDGRFAHYRITDAFAASLLATAVEHLGVRSDSP